MTDIAKKKPGPIRVSTRVLDELHNEQGRRKLALGGGRAKAPSYGALLEEAWDKAKQTKATGELRRNAGPEAEVESLVTGNKVHYADINSQWHRKLEFILNSRKLNAISAVQENIDVFFDYTGGTEEPNGETLSASHPKDRANRKRKTKGATRHPQTR